MYWRLVPINMDQLTCPDVCRMFRLKNRQKRHEFKHRKLRDSYETLQNVKHTLMLIDLMYYDHHMEIELYRVSIWPEHVVNIHLVVVGRLHKINHKPQRPQAPRCRALKDERSLPVIKFMRNEQRAMNCSNMR